MTRNPRHRRPKELGPHKLGVCRWCGGPARPPRRYWCSDRCVREWQSFDPRALRVACWKRDGGLCRLCGRDVGQLERFLRRMRDTAKRAGWHPERVPAELAKRARRWAGLIRQLRIDLRHLWEADHKIPVCEGGPNCLANLRTLCLPCHKAETKKLAARRAQKRRAQLPLIPASA